jgi:hypothetical protein
VVIKSSNRDPPQLSAVRKVHNHGSQTIKWAGIGRNTNQPAKPPLYIAKKGILLSQLQHRENKINNNQTMNLVTYAPVN